MKRAYDAYDKAESDWVTSMNTARRTSHAEGRVEIVDLLRHGASPADIIAKYGR